MVKQASETSVMRCAVLVLGDLGRSPRMQYHALSLANEGARVELVGYAENPVYHDIETHPNIRIRPLPPPSPPAAPSLGRIRFVTHSLFRVVRQTAGLIHFVFFRLDPCDLLLVQSPPAIPTLPVIWIACRLRGMRFAVDWHNFGHTVLALRLSERGLVVRLARLVERFFGRRAGTHLCVSKAMATRLRDDFGIASAAVLYDKPAAPFRPRGKTADDRQAFLTRVFGEAHDPRSKLLVSPSSWSLDENMDVVLETARLYDEKVDADPDPGRFPDLEIFLSGRGPGCTAFEDRLAKRTFSHVRIRTGWLPPEDYPVVLACADLGLCLHTSSSKVDLPMKLADMAGASLPACVFDYGPCLREQFADGEGGWLFSSPTDLASLLARIVIPGPDGAPAPLEQLRARLGQARVEHWEEHWRDIAAPVLLPPADSGELSK